MHRGGVSIGCLILCAISVSGYVGTTAAKAAHGSRRGPVIQMEEERIRLDTAEGEPGMLRGIVAQDPEDGTVTDSLVVESVSSFFPDKSREVTVAAFDSDGNVSRAMRRITYNDYVPPRILLKGPLTVKTTELDKIHDLIQVQDCLDGDLSDEVRILSDNGTRMYSGNYAIHLQVTNSAGDTTDLPVTVTLYDYDAQRGNVQILLNEYIVYLKKGERPDWKNYLKGLVLNGREQYWDSETAPWIEKSRIQIQNQADTDTPGVYETEYSLDSEGYTGNVRLVVVVEE